MKKLSGYEGMVTRQLFCYNLTKLTVKHLFDYEQVEKRIANIRLTDRRSEIYV